MEYYVYMVKCANGAFYTGITNDLDRRLRQHNGDIPGGAKYTNANRPVVLVFSQKVSSKSQALTKEYELKQLSHQEKQLLAEKT